MMDFGHRWDAGVPSKRPDKQVIKWMDDMCNAVARCWRLCISQYPSHNAVLFHCQGGRHRSYAAAVAFMLWSVRVTNVDEIDGYCKSLNSKFHLGMEDKVVKGKMRRGWGLDVKDFEAFVHRTGT